MITIEKLSLLPRANYEIGLGSDPINYYFWPVLGDLYRKRVEIALNECAGGESILEVGYGSGVAFLNLSKKYKFIFGVDTSAVPDLVAAVFSQYGISPNLHKGCITNLAMFESNSFDTVFAISILEHLKSDQLESALKEISRVLKPGGQLVYGVPVDRKMMTVAFSLLGHNIKNIHFSSYKEIEKAVRVVFESGMIINMASWIPFVGPIYQVGNFKKAVEI